MSVVRQTFSPRSILDLVSAVMSGKGGDLSDKRDSIYVFGIRVASAALIYFSQVLLARWMGDFQFGVYAYVWVITTILGVISTFGMNTVVMRFIPHYKESGELSKLKALLFTSRITSLTLGVLIAAFGYLMISLFEAVIPSYYVVPLVLALVCLPFYALMDLQEGIGRAEGWLSWGLLPLFIVRPFIVLIFMGGAIYFGAPADATTCLLAVLAATFFTALVQWMFMHIKASSYLPVDQKEYDLKMWLGVALPLLFMDGFYLFMTHTDILVINNYLSPSDVAIYYAAMKTTYLIAFVKYAIISVFVPKFSKLHTAGKKEELNAYVRKSITWTFWPSAIAAVGIIVMGVPFLWMFGPQFVSGYPVILVLVIGLLATASVGPVENLLNMVGQQKFVALVLFATCIANLIFNIALVPVYGLLGAAIATTLSVLLSSLALFLGAKKRLGIYCFILGHATERR